MEDDSDHNGPLV